MHLLSMFVFLVFDGAEQGESEGGRGGKREGEKGREREREADRQTLTAEVYNIGCVVCADHLLCDL